MKGMKSNLVRRAARRPIDTRDYAATFRAEDLAAIEKLGLAYNGDGVEIYLNLYSISNRKLRFNG